MPKSPSTHLLALGSRLSEIRDKSLVWRLSTDFCLLHEAETTVIPLGIRDGFGRAIDFRQLQARLISGWMLKELAMLVTSPNMSSFFGNVVGDIEKMGMEKWRSLSHQGSEKVVEGIQPG